MWTLQVSLLPVSGYWPGKMSRMWMLVSCRIPYRLTSQFPLCSLQMIVTVVVLYAAKKTNTVQFQDFDRSVPFKVSSVLFIFPSSTHHELYSVSHDPSLCIFNFLPDFPSSFTLCWEPHNRTGRHQKAQVA